MTFWEWLTSNRYIVVLEGLLKTQREDFLRQLDEKNVEIRRLRAELASRGVRMIAEPEPPRKTFVPSGEAVAFPGGPLDWQGELHKLLEDEEETADV